MEAPPLVQARWRSEFRRLAHSSAGLKAREHAVRSAPVAVLAALGEELWVCADVLLDGQSWLARDLLDVIGGSVVAAGSV
jgi:hypothetical protein